MVAHYQGGWAQGRVRRFVVTEVYRTQVDRATPGTMQRRIQNVGVMVVQQLKERSAAGLIRRHQMRAEQCRWPWRSR